MAPLPPMYHFSWGKLTSVIHCDPLWRPQQKETSSCQQPRGELGSSPLALCPPSSDAVKAIGPLQGPKGFDLQTLAEDGKEEFREMGRGRAPLRVLPWGRAIGLSSKGCWEVEIYTQVAGQARGMETDQVETSVVRAPGYPRS